MTPRRVPRNEKWEETWVVVVQLAPMRRTRKRDKAIKNKKAKKQDLVGPIDDGSESTSF